MSNSLSRIRALLHRFFAPTRLLKDTYRAFREVLRHDHRSHELLTLLERLYHDESRVDFCAVSRTYDDLSLAVLEMIRHLDRMAPGSYRELFSVFQGIDAAARDSALRFAGPEPHTPLALPLGQLPARSPAVTGGKAANLSRIAADLALPVPKGFVLTTRAFDLFCEVHRLRPRIEAALAEVRIDSPASLEAASAGIVSTIRASAVPPDLEKAIRDTWLLTFGELAAEGTPSPGKGTRPCAVRSSAVGEDAAFSFAGQYETVLHVDAARVAEAYKEVIASKYSPNALFYRIKNGFLDQETPMAVLVLEMVDAAASGIVYSRSPVDLGSTAVTLYSIWGLGEPLVRGGTAPDVIEVARDGSGTILMKKQGIRETKAVPAPSQGIETVPLEPGEKEHPSLDEVSASRLAAWAVRLESYFGAPQDMEWCLDREGRLYILQSRPLRVESPREDSCRLLPADVPNRVLFSGGEKAVSGVGTGKVVVAHSAADLKDLPQGAVLVAHSTSPGWVRVMERLGAVVTDLGSAAGHFASVAREWRVPTLVNTGFGTRILTPGEVVTVDADHGRIYAGAVQRVSPSPCETKTLPAGSPFMKRLSLLLDHCARLHLLDPQHPGFVPQECRTLHDIVRYTHEKAVQEMFSMGDRGRGRVKGARRLISEIPVTLYVLDMGDGTGKRGGNRREIRLEEVRNAGLHALWKGLSHPEILWSPDVLHFDWEEFDRLSAGIISLDSQMLSSFAILSEDYLNIHIRFGYHFVVIDALFGGHFAQNYISMRFKGGGAVQERKHLRLQFLDLVMSKHGFDTRFEGDRIDATQQGSSSSEVEGRLEMLGFLLGFTRLLDQKLEDREGVTSLATEFLTKYPPV